MAKAQVFQDPARPGINYVIGAKGERLYLAPNGPSGRAGVFANKEWNAHTGQYDTKRDWNNVVGALTLGAIAAPAVAGAAGVGGGAAVTGGGGTVGGAYGATAPAIVSQGVSTAAATGGGMGLGSKAVEVGIGAGSNVYGSKKQAQSTRRAQDIQSRADAETLAYERERDAELKRQWEATQEMEARKFAAAEEQRLHDRQLADEAEARRAPYRAASQAALGKLGTILGIQFPQQSATRTTSGPAPMPTRGDTWHGMPVSSTFGSEARLAPSGPLSQRATEPDYAPVNPPPATTMGDFLNLRPRTAVR